MKKLAVALFACFTVLLVVVAIWLQFPRLHEPEHLKAMRDSAQDRFQRLQAEATDPAKNGFLNPTFLPYWGRKGQERQPDSAVERQVKAWLEFSSAGQAKLVDHKALALDPKYLAARADFQKLAPELMASMAKPVFIAPDKSANLTIIVPNFIAVRACAQAMTGLAEDSAAQGRPAEAANMAVRVLEFGRTLQNQLFLIGDMIGIAVQATGVDAYVGLLDPESKLTAEQWKDLAGRLLMTIPPKDQMVLVMESEADACLATLEMVRNGDPVPEDAMPMGGLLKIPGVLGHEERIYSNMAVELDNNLRLPDPQRHSDHIDALSNTDYLTGKVGVLGMIMLPNFVRAEAQMEFARAKLTGLTLATGMIAYRAEKGKLPTDFEELRAAGIAVPDKATLETVEAKYADGVITLPFRGILLGDPSTERFLYGPRPWYQIKDSVVTIRL